MFTNHFPSVRRVCQSILLLGSILFWSCSKEKVNESIALSSEDVLLCTGIKNINNKWNIPGFIVDQSNTSFPLPFYYNINLTPIGQEFTPTLHAVDAVVLRFDDASCSLSDDEGGILRVRIRKDNINGTIIGTSDTVQFPNCFVGTRQFNFPSFIPLVPGKQYVIEPIHYSGNTATLFINNYGSSYAGGRFILSGQLQPEKDLWFQEGLYRFIARHKYQAMNGGWKRVVRHDGTTFRNQGECLKYINTGR